MNSIIYDEEIITPKNNKYHYYRKFIKKLNKKDCVKLALFCAKIINQNTKESNDCINLVEKWLKDEKSVSKQELYIAYASNSTYASYAAYAAYHSATTNAAFYAAASNVSNISVDNIHFINKYLQILLRKTKQFGNNKILEQISKTDVDKLELVDWNMITDIMQEEYNIIHEFEYEDIFSRGCLIELLRREYV